MSRKRDIAAFEGRAAGYEQGWLGQFHRQIVDRTAALVLSTHPPPSRVLDVGCGTGYLLRLVASRCPDGVELAGIDPVPAMVDVAVRATDDQRIVIQEGAAERLPYPDDRFDLVLSVTSFDHWSDQAAGMSECARVLAPGGHLVIADLFSAWLAPTLVASRRGKARTKGRANSLLTRVGLHPVSWDNLFPLIKAVSAVT